MTLTKECFSPKSSSGSFVLAILVHGAIYGLLVGVLGLGLGAVEPKPEYLDLGYQTFDRPPEPEKKEQKVVRSNEPVRPPDPKAVQDDAPKELQDDKGEVAGTQKAKVENNIGNASEGTAASTPYYKIKPKYPKAAIIAGTEGWVLLEVDITETGTVENVRVVDGEQRNLFGSEARRAVEQWKYRPFMDSAGHPVRKSSHQVRVDFKLNEIESAGT
ncbi:MAG: TonB family protein [Bdellovibrionales bacterium]